MEKAVTTSPKARRYRTQTMPQPRAPPGFSALEALAYVPSELQKDALEVVKSSPEVLRMPCLCELVKCLCGRLFFSWRGQ